MTPRTPHPIPREDLLAHARKRAAAQTPGTSDADMAEIIVAILEAYPLIDPAADCVRVICDDLADRAGFREVVEAMGPVDWKELRDHLAVVLRSAVVFTTPVAVEKPEGDALDFA